MPGRNDDYAMLAESVLPDEAKRADVVVIGGGSAGLSSAIAAREAGADVLVPLMVVLVVHADLPHGYALLQHVKQTLDSSVIDSELGYCLCTFEVAMEHVRQSNAYQPIYR